MVASLAFSVLDIDAGGEKYGILEEILTTTQRRSSFKQLLDLVDTVCREKRYR